MSSKILIPKVSLARDDRYSTFTHGDTTLVLCTANFTATQLVCEVSTRRLIVYADEIFFTGGLLNLPGKDIRLHCNRVQCSKPQSIDLSGAKGRALQTVADGQENGQDGGNLTLHVHNLEMKGSNMLWSDKFNVNVSGGAAGSSRKDGQQDGAIIRGSPGEPGSIQILYGNRLSRLVAALKDVYMSKTESITAKFSAMSVDLLPEIEYEWKRLGLANAELVASAITQVRDVRALMVTLARVKDGLQDVRLLLGDSTRYVEFDNIVQISEGCSHLHGLPLKLATDLQQAIEEFCGNPGAHTSSAIGDRLNSLLSFAKTNRRIAEPMPPSLSVKVTQIVEAVRELRESLQDRLLANLQGDLSPHIAQVSYTKDGRDDLEKRVPLVHPDHCAMLLREADAYYFANKPDQAKAIYVDLQERLSFVKPLLAQSPDIDGPYANLRKAFITMDQEGLSQWTFETLHHLYLEINTRMTRLLAGKDLFGFAENWVPRLSYKYYSESAREQVARLKDYEKSYWNFFDHYQDQMDNQATLSYAAAANTSRLRQIEEDMTFAEEIITQKEKAIRAATGPLSQQKKELQDAIAETTRKVGGLHMPSVGTMLTAGVSLVACVALTVGTGGLAAVVAAGSAAAGLKAIQSEAMETMEDDNGVRVNTKYVVTQLTSTSGDLKAVTADALQVSKDGTIGIGEDDTRKLACTQKQLKDFREQFKNSLDSRVSARLSDAIDAFFGAAEKRNQDIIAYTRAVITLTEKRSQKMIFQRQAKEIGSQAIRINASLPSIVAYYQRLRCDIRMRILRTIRLASLAMRFWGLSDSFDGLGPNLLAMTDEMSLHIEGISTEQERMLSDLASYLPQTWPVGVDPQGILYSLSADELAGLKLEQVDYKFASKDAGGNEVYPKWYTVTINGLKSPTMSNNSIMERPFSVHANVRIAQVRLWIPGLEARSRHPCEDCQDGQARSNQPSHAVLEAKGTVKCEKCDSPSPSFVNISIKHGGVESIMHPRGKEFIFVHDPIDFTFTYDMSKVHTRKDIDNQYSKMQQHLPSEWSKTDASSQTFAPVGPFTTWTVSIREYDNGPLDWTNVKNAYLEFHGSSMPFST